METPSWPQVPGYVLLERLGEGASGEVWRARRDADGLQIALKVVRAGDDDLAGALREAGVLARVRHPHLLHLYDVVPVPDETGASTCLGLAVQLAGGGSLAQVLAARRHLTPGELVTLLVPLAGALEQLHAAGIVHGDVSPGNVLFLADGMPMLADVGVTRLVGEADRAVHGTDGMLAPETLEGFAPGPEADIYALGALAWWCLTGGTPGWVGTRPELADLVPDVPEGMRDLVLRAMSPEPEDRPEAQEVPALVLGLAEPEPIEVSPDADPGTGLTRRLRAVARAEHEAGVEASEGSRRWWGARRRTADPPRHRHPRAHRTERGRALTGLAPLGVILVLGLLAAVAAAGLVTGAGARTGVLSPAGSTTVAGVNSTAAASARAPTASTSPGSRRAPTATTPPASRRAPTAPTGRPSTNAGGSSRTQGDGSAPADPIPPDARAVVQSAVDARALAWRRTDPDLLGSGLAPDSPAMHADRAGLAEALRRGVAYDGVGFDVVDATVESVDGAPEPAFGVDGLDSARELRIRATVRSTAMSARTGAGAHTTTEASVDDVTLELRRTDHGWRIWSWQ